jgi:cell division protein FtsZ
VDPDANIIVGSTLDDKMEGRMRVSVVATGIDVSAEASEPHRDVYGAATLRDRGRAQPVPEAAAQEAEAPAAREASPEPSLFESFADEEPPVNLFEPEDASDDVPPPAYRPAPAPQVPVRPQPVASREAEPQADAMADDGFVAPRAAKATPEHLSALREAIRRDVPRGETPAQGRAPAEASHGKSRFGINNLINRMTGHGEDHHAPVQRRAPSFSGQPPQSHIPAREEETAVDPDQERIEIPAFLRRQAN